jgi:cytochrome d ubiquinol oxidase subunit I
MSDLFAARTQMAFSLGFHILFAIAGMAMPLLMVLAEAWHHKTGEKEARVLAEKWAKGTAILFAVGAVSGTVLSFELGLLWPTFMEKAGPLIGLPFSLEGFAFFLEGIFLGIYLYGWKKLSPGLHIAAGVGVAVSGTLSGALVVSVNGWMNTPTGFELKDGAFTNIEPWVAFFNPAFFTEALHMVLAAYASLSVVVLGIHAALLLRNPESRMHRRAAKIAFSVAVVAVPLLILSGDLSAKHIAREQPLKLAAAESLFETQKMAPLAIGGIPDVETRTLKYAIEIPGALSVLSFTDPNAEVKGLDAFPEEDWPPVPVVHIAFQIMVACGFTMLTLVVFGLLLWWRKEDPTRDRRFLWFATLASPLGLLAVEAGWTVTEVGRQPYIIQGIMKTADAVTPMTGLWFHFLTFTLLYGFLGVVVVVLMKAHVLATDGDVDDLVDEPKGPALARGGA